ncbi:beclin 1 [Sporothrix brasiliensis 5110]|uniref:Beclin 1 n=1 Tax=Sporothrix brasiliensis 5110 TaxID=1398154 RepID=A0A0C2JBQ9_9PEZI|nr:beclin 1 [Sporothrix brasiliensis 5110]KIH94317.1 beclin 1 [Sporothrix brasiliensis 5110]
MYCQKCRTPLKLDSSLEDLNPAAKRQQIRPANAPDADRRALYDHVSKHAGPSSFKRYSGGGSGGSAESSGGSMRDSSAMSFVLLSDSTIAGGPSHGGSAGPGAGFGGTAPARYGSGASDEDKNKNFGTGDVAGADDDDASKAQGMERITKLFEIMSARSDVDHPVCVECTELLVEGLQQRLDAASRERDAYVSFLKTQQTDVPTADELQAQAAALAKARQQEADAMAELLQLEAEKGQLDEEIRALEREAQALDRDEEQFWRERNAFASKLTDFQNERDSINAKYDHDARLLERLQRSNVYNDTFCISHDGTFATINGLRLGRLSSRPVDWPEINAAWGHALLLLVTVADKLNFRFENYEPLPMGSTSRIVRYEPLPSPASSRLGGGDARGGSGSGSGGGGASGGSGGGFGAASILSQRLSAPPQAPKKHVLELYSSGDMPLGLTFMHRRFDNAMVAFLELVRQLGVFVHQQTSAAGAGERQHPLSLPYRIEGDRIGDVSIKLGIAQDDGWTKACKLTLTCCKFLLAHASNVNSSGRG